MKKNYFLKALGAFAVTVLMAVGTPEVKAQGANPGPNFGIKGGLNLSQLFVDQPNVQDENMKVGYHLGFFAKMPVSDIFSIQPELLYTNTGSKITYGGSDLANVLGIDPGEVRFNLNYVQLPVALGVNLGPLNLHAGPYVSYLVNANVTDLNTADLNATEVIQLDSDDFNRIDYGVLVGVGFDVGGVTIGARYNYGLREIGATGVAGNLTNNSRNSVGQIYVGFGF
jgi:hypothetical protein